MDRDNVKIENIFKTEDNEERKEAVLASLISLVEKDLEKGVRMQAIILMHDYSGTSTQAQKPGSG